MFTVRVPLRPAPRDAADAAPVPGGARVRRRALIVGDNDDARDMLRHLLERTGHEGHQAADGLTGLDRAFALELDGAVIDIGLPGLDGYEVARRGRAAGRADVLLAVVTGYGQAGDRRRWGEAGFEPAA